MRESLVYPLVVSVGYWIFLVGYWIFFDLFKELGISEDRYYIKADLRKA
jgi:hypothetical protein